MCVPVARANFSPMPSWCEHAVTVFLLAMGLAIFEREFLSAWRKRLLADMRLRPTIVALSAARS